MIINEMKRREIISRSKDDQLGRFSSRLGVNNVSINRVGLLELAYLDQPDLDIHFDVSGHSVTISLVNYMKNLRQEYKKNYSKIRNEGGMTISKSMRKIVEDSLKKAIDNGDIKVNCDCPDFTYRFSYVASKRGYKFGDQEERPAVKRNPKNKGSACKHIIKVLNSPSDWRSLVVTGLVNMLKKNPGILDR